MTTPAGRRRPQPGPAEPVAVPVATPPPDEALPVVVEVAGVIALLLVTVVAAALAVLLTPFRVGTALIPVAVVLAVAANVVLPRLAYAVTRSRGVAALPVLAFFVTGWVLSISPGGDVLLAGGSDGQSAVSYATLLGGVAAGAVTAVRTR